MFSVVSFLFNKFSLFAALMLGALVLGWKVGSLVSQQDAALIQDKLHRCQQAHAKEKHAWLEQQQQAQWRWQQRYQHALHKAHEADSYYQQHLQELNQRHDKLKTELNRLKDGAASCVLSFELVQHVNAAFGVPTHHPATVEPAPTAAGIIRAPGQSQTLKSKQPSGVTQKALLANLTDNAHQCLAWRAQINGLLDYIEGLHHDARN